MPKHNPNQSLADSLERIERAQSIVRRHGFDAIRADYVLADALLHNLLIASEAVTRLKNEWPERFAALEMSCPDVNWYAFRRFGDVLRHGYELIDLAIVERNMNDLVPKIKRAIEGEIALSTIEPASPRTDEYEPTSLP